MSFDASWAKVLGIALSLPSTIIGTALLCNEVYKRGYIPYWLAVLIFVLIVTNTLFILVLYAYKRKNQN